MVELDVVDCCRRRTRTRVRGRLIKGEIDDPFDDRFHALEQMAII